jgi:methyltransferase (TIGR00027 family)
MAAAARAAHLEVDAEPIIFADRLAAPLLGELAEEPLSYHRSHGNHPILAGVRAQVTCRSQYTETRLNEAIDRGVEQYVVLAAGLDSYAYGRAPDGLRVFELDHPRTQRWKLQRLDAAGIPVPAGTRHVPLDFETEDLVDGASTRGFDPERAAVFSWLGCTMYLTGEAISATLATIGGLAPGTELIFDYYLPETLRDEAGRAYAEAIQRSTADQGEPWLSFFTPEELSTLLARHGLTDVRHVRQREMVEPNVWQRSDSLCPNELARIAHAIVGS